MGGHPWLPPHSATFFSLTCTARDHVVVLAYAPHGSPVYGGHALEAVVPVAGCEQVRVLTLHHAKAMGGHLEGAAERGTDSPTHHRVTKAEPWCLHTEEQPTSALVTNGQRRGGQSKR